jgi:BASS family bile acid:Na+ symporter
MQTAQKACLIVAAASVLLLIAGLALGNASVWQGAAVAATVGLAIGLGGVESLRTYQFTAWIIAGVVAALVYPEHILSVGGVDMRDKRIILGMMQLVMFGMGTQMSLSDLAGVIRMPYAVLIGTTLQFTVMPLIGFTLASTLGLPPEVAAGVILVGSCSSGLASNVMTYIAKANLPLSITLTAVATLVAPIMTPLWMKILASTMVEVDFFGMMIEIIKLVMVPIGAAMLADHLEHSTEPKRRAIFLVALAALALLVAEIAGWSRLSTKFSPTALRGFEVAGFLLGAIVAGVAYYWLKRRVPKVAQLMPVAAMLGIVFVTSVTASAGRDRLLAIGWLLLIAVMIHNSAGYLLGYWLARAFGLDRNSARTVALEVGLQNGGMATTIAAAQGQLATLGLAAAVFSPWMNVSGSILANYWRKRPTDFAPAELAATALEAEANQREAN